MAGAEIGPAGPGEITSMDASPRDTKPGRSRSRSAAKRPDQAAPGAPAPAGLSDEDVKPLLA
jgi:hypothetical protein